MKSDEKIPNSHKQSPNSDEQIPIKDEQIPIKDEQIPIKDEQIPIKDEQSPIRDDQSPISGQEIRIHYENSPKETAVYIAKWALYIIDSALCKEPYTTWKHPHEKSPIYRMVQCGAVWCSVVQWWAAWCSVLQCVAALCNVFVIGCLIQGGAES